MPTYKLVLQYVGTRYAGWQVQPELPTIQGEVQARLRRLFDDEELQVAGAARTDAGTHARGQVATFRAERVWDPARLRHSLNGLLPGDIAVAEAALRDDGFHARRSATGRTYRYQVGTGEFADPFTEPFVHHHRGSLDAGAMASAASLILGEHDFTSFKSSGDVSHTPVKTIHRSTVEREGLLLVYEVEGTSFLQHMVRTIAGTLLEVGRGRRPAAWMKEVLAARDRTAAGPTLPARGLFLERVHYPDGL